MKALPRGTKTVVYTPEYMGGFGIHTVTEWTICFSEHLLKEYYDKWDGIIEIRKYLGIGEDDCILRLTFDSNYNLLEFKRDYHITHLYYVWIAANSLIEI